MYMAPEVLHHKPYNALADVWSLGTLLYFLLCGKYPFQARNLDDLKHKVMNGKYSLDLPVSLECVNFV